MKRRLLIARTDRLGDVMMALPTLPFVRQNLPEWEIDFACRPEFIPVLSPTCQDWRIRLVPSGEWDRLTHNYNALLALHPEKDLIKAAFRDRVPIRVGVRSKPSSFLFLNYGLIQHRSRGLKSEAVYNLDLAALLLRKVGCKDPKPFEGKIKLKISDSVMAKAKNRLEGLGINRPFSVFHPGIGGSALIPSLKTYFDLLKRLMSQKEFEVLLSIGPAEKDQELAAAIQKEFPDIKISRRQSLEELAAMFSIARFVMAPATGPLHLAHFVGASTFGLYSPLTSEAPSRWTSWGGVGKAETLAPDIVCPGGTHCIGSSCQYYYCMDTNNWNELVDRAFRSAEVGP